MIDYKTNIYNSENKLVATIDDSIGMNKNELLDLTTDDKVISGIIYKVVNAVDVSGGRIKHTISYYIY